MKTKHLDFYYECLEKNRLPHKGLCNCALTGLISPGLLIHFIPDSEELFSLGMNGLSQGWWASDVEFLGDTFTKEYGFSELRQNIVLLMAAMNNEL